MWQWIEKQTLSSNDFVSMLACTWCVLILGVLRFAHVQRSRITALTPVALHMSALRGKRRQQGRTRPFSHRCPRIGITSRDFGKQLYDYLHRAAASNKRTELPHWLQWDYGPPGKGLTEVTHLLPRPMPQYRFVKFTKELLVRSGSPVAGV